MTNQCVPSWDLEETVGAGINPVPGPALRMASADTAPIAVPMPDQYDEVAELTWEKGNIFWQGLLNRSAPKYPAAPAPSQMHAIGSGGDHRETLEAVVGEAAARLSSHPHLPQSRVPAAEPWLGVGAPADGLVPCAVRGDDAAEVEARRKRARLVGEDGRVCASQGSVAPGRVESTLLTLDPCGTGADDVCRFTTTTNNSTSLDHGSPEETENTSFGGGASDSRCFSRRSQGDGLCDEAENNVVIKGEAPMRSSISTKRSRAAAIHNESERKRRDRINQKMQTLQKLVPNSSKTDKASMLDEVIDHLKQLQAQVQMMSRMSSMMMPMAMPQLQMSVMANMAQMAQMAQMGLGMMNMAGPLAQPAYPGLAPAMTMMHPSTPFVQMQPWNVAADQQKQPAAAVPDAYSAFLACQAAQQNAQQQQQQTQPNGMEAYNRMMAMYQNLSQQQTQTQSGISKE